MDISEYIDLGKRCAESHNNCHSIIKLVGLQCDQLLYTPLMCVAARRQDDKCTWKYNSIAATVNMRDSFNAAVNRNIADGSELS